MFGAFSFGSLINDLEEGVNTTFMILGNAGVLQMPIKRDKKKRKENKKSNSVKSLLFYASVSWAKQEHFLFSHVLRSSILISSGSVQFPKATFTFLKLSFCNNPSSPIFLTYFFLVGVCQIPKNQCKKRTWRRVNLSTTVICVLDDQ